jgi:hypothetical protein
MDTAQPVAATMIADLSQQAKESKQQDDQVRRLRGGGICTDCLAYYL